MMLDVISRAPQRLGVVLEPAQAIVALVAEQGSHVELHSRLMVRGDVGVSSTDVAPILYPTIPLRATEDRGKLNIATHHLSVELFRE